MLRTIYVATVTVMLLVFVSGSMSFESDKVTNVQIALKSFAAELERGEIPYTEIFFISYDRRAFTRVTPDTLESNPDFTVRVKLTDPLRRGLIDAINKTKTTPRDEYPDLRWGAVFYDEADRRVHSIYLDGRYITGSGRRGVIDGRAVNLNGRLIRWFEDNFLAQAEGKS